MNTIVSPRIETLFRCLSLVILVALSAVQVAGADVLFGSLIERGFIPRDLSFVGIAAPVLNVVHMLIYGGLAVSFTALAVYGTSAWQAGLYVALPTGLQVLYNGCVLTDVQNALWTAQGIAPITNDFIFAAFIPLPVVVTKVMVFVLAVLFALPAVVRLIAFLRSRYGVTVMVPRMPLETWPSTEQ